MNSEPLHFRPDHALYTGRICWRVFLALEQGDRIRALQIVRRWLVDAGMGDSYERACRFVRDVAEMPAYIRSQMDKTLPVRRQDPDHGKKVRTILRRAKEAKSRRHVRLLRGKFEALISDLSYPLQESAMNEFRRVAANPDRY